MYVAYAHPSLCKTPDWWKIGVAITPYSAARIRQRFMIAPFEIPYLWFGKSEDILKLESAVINRFPRSARGNGNTEMVNCTSSDLLDFIQNCIAGFSNCSADWFMSDRSALDIIELPLKSPYTATNSSDCPFGFPSEKNIHEWAIKECDNLFGTKSNPSMIYSYIADQHRIAQQRAEQEAFFSTLFKFG